MIMLIAIQTITMIILRDNTCIYIYNLIHIIILVCGWETPGSSLAPHLIGNMNTHSSLAPS